jgi:hypothetical protein
MQRQADHSSGLAAVRPCNNGCISPPCDLRNPRRRARPHWSAARSIFERAAASRSDPDAASPDRLALRVDARALYCGQPGVQKVSQRPGFEAVLDEHDFLGSSERNAGQQSKCPPLFHAYMTVWSQSLIHVLRCNFLLEPRSPRGQHEGTWGCVRADHPLARMRKVRRGCSWTFRGLKSGRRVEFREVLRSRHKLNRPRCHPTVCTIRTLLLLPSDPAWPFMH